MSSLRKVRSWSGRFHDEAVDERSRMAEPGHDITLTLVALIVSKAGSSVDLIWRDLDEGADLNKARPYQHRDSLCPLSAAITANSESVFRPLLE